MKPYSLKTAIFVFLSAGLFLSTAKDLDSAASLNSNTRVSTPGEIIDYLEGLHNNSSHSLFQLHCESIIKIIAETPSFSSNELQFLDTLYSTFTDTTLDFPGSSINTYTSRHRPYIVSWTSPTDSVVSLAWLLPPENWEEGKSYPLYIVLHGLYGPYQNKFEYMVRYFSSNNYIEKPFQDGYSLYPWGRGNLWYLGKGQTDIWEALSFIEGKLNIIPERKYLTGHSMGGFGTWVIGQDSPGEWAGLGVYAGALWYDNNRYLNASTAERLKDVPVYFVCGTQDGLMSVNVAAYDYLEGFGNVNIKFITFEGGHESLYENWDSMYQWLKQFSKPAVYVDENEVPGIKKSELANNYPNPFNSSTIIHFKIPLRSQVDLRVYDLLGRETAVLVNGLMDAGSYNIEFKPSFLNGEAASGIYFYTLRVGDFTSTGKMIFSK